MSEANVEVVKPAIEEFNRGDVDGMPTEAFSDDGDTVVDIRATGGATGAPSVIQVGSSTRFETVSTALDSYFVVHEAVQAVRLT
jgi:hypothetical protein